MALVQLLSLYTASTDCQLLSYWTVVMPYRVAHGRLLYQAAVVVPVAFCSANAVLRGFGF